MKYFTAFLAAVVVVFATQSEASPLDTLHNLDDTILTTVDFVQAFKIAFPVDANQRFDHVLESKRDEVLDSIEDALREVQEQGEESGKNVTHCKHQVELELRAVYEKVLPKLHKCFEEAAPDWSVHDNDFNNLIKKGQELHHKNEEIEKKCESPLPWASNLCISIKLPHVRLATGLYRGEVAKCKQTVFESFYAVVAAIEKCLEEPISNFKNEVYNAMKIGFECIEKA